MNAIRLASITGSRLSGSGRLGDLVEDAMRTMTLEKFFLIMKKDFDSTGDFVRCHYCLAMTCKRNAYVDEKRNLMCLKCGKDDVAAQSKEYRSKKPNHVGWGYRT